MLAVPSASLIGCSGGPPCREPRRGPERRKRGACNARHPADRRDVLLGLGAAAAGLAMSQRGGRLGLAQPIQTLELQNCKVPLLAPNTGDINCCPVYRAGTKAVQFEFPPASSPLRVRPAAHLVDQAYVAKYEKGVELMKQLPEDDPRSFAQQWRVHCAYCDGAYRQVGFPELEIQIHSSWLFFPWHRLYIYFHERILGKLIQDEGFALPYWNWDAPHGMSLPPIYTNPSSPLYNERRDQAHQPPTTVDLDFNGTESSVPRDEQIQRNLRLMYRQMVSGATKKELFFGQPYRAGDDPEPGAGSVEAAPHNPLHNWCGDPREPNREDMGAFYSAARDPLFYCHHANVDRMWTLWSRINRCPGFTDDTWLNASFLFYDEEARLVRVRVRDCVDTAALRYTFQDVGLPWLNAKPSTEVGPLAPAAAGALPATLNETVRVIVTRPRIWRSQREKDYEEEVLVVEGIEIAHHDTYVKFDVYVSKGGAGMTAAVQCAGRVALMPHVLHRSTKHTNTTARFAIGEVLDEIGANGDTTITVSLVPRCSGQRVTVSGIRIEFLK